MPISRWACPACCTPLLPARGAPRSIPDQDLSNTAINWQLPRPWRPASKQYHSVSASYVSKTGWEGSNFTSHCCGLKQPSSSHTVLPSDSWFLLSAPIPALPFTTQLHACSSVFAFMSVTAYSIQLTPVMAVSSSVAAGLQYRSLKCISQGSDQLQAPRGYTKSDQFVFVWWLVRKHQDCSPARTELQAARNNRQAFTGSKQTPQGKWHTASRALRAARTQRRGRAVWLRAAVRAQGHITSPQCPTALPPAEMEQGRERWLRL